MTALERLGAAAVEARRLANSPSTSRTVALANELEAILASMKRAAEGAAQRKGAA